MITTYATPVLIPAFFKVLLGISIVENVLFILILMFFIGDKTSNDSADARSVCSVAIVVSAIAIILSVCIYGVFTYRFAPLP